MLDYTYNLNADTNYEVPIFFHKFINTYSKGIFISLVAPVSAGRVSPGGCAGSDGCADSCVCAKQNRKVCGIMHMTIIKLMAIEQI